MQEGMVEGFVDGHGPIVVWSNFFFPYLDWCCFHHYYDIAIRHKKRIGSKLTHPPPAILAATYRMRQTITHILTHKLATCRSIYLTHSSAQFVKVLLIVQAGVIKEFFDVTVQFQCWFIVQTTACIQIAVLVVGTPRRCKGWVSCMHFWHSCQSCLWK